MPTDFLITVQTIVVEYVQENDARTRSVIDATGSAHYRLPTGPGEMDGRFQSEAAMNRRTTKLIREGEYVIEVEVELSDAPDGWGPYLSPADAMRLDEARAALRRGDLTAAAQLGRVFRLTPVKASA
jgi:hypothetical protein